ncbi:MAG: hypothetical protein KIT34_13220 [Cyanobacteria bacterium TGS_CYA1]|nr:hypothetical protein [Cyanobacteria bacterium TGS_CYA1]
MKKLTKKQFDTALRRGLGRALMHVKEHGIGNFVEPLERACLKRYSYDRLDSGRSAWLYELIKAGRMQKHFSFFIKTNIRNYTSCEDLIQIAFLAEYLYFDGEKSFKKILRDLFEESYLQFKDPWIVGANIMNIEEIEGAEFVYKIVFSHEKNDSNDLFWFTSSLFESFEFDDAVAILKRSAGEFKWAQDFIEQVIAEELNSKTKKSGKKIKRTPNDVIEAILENKIFPGFSSLARSFTVEERLEVLNALPKANKLMHIWYFFEFFEKVELPELKKSTFKSAMIKQLGPRARMAIFKALSNSKDDRIWKFAYDSIKKDRDCIRLGAIELFKNNYKKGDCDFILESIRKMRTPRNKHNTFIDLRHVLENNKKKELLPCIIWLWENSPCAMCRGFLIDIFRNTKILPKWLLEEGLYDSDNDTREWSKKTLTRY